MAGTMKRDLGIEVAAPARNTEPVDDVVAKFPSAPPQLGHGRQVGLLFKFEQSAVIHHGGAGTGRHHDRALTGERFYRVAHDFARGSPVAAVEGGQTAASLARGEI